MKNITLSASKELIEQAREKAIAEKTSLNVKFRDWLAQYVGKTGREKKFLDLIKRLEHVKYDGKMLNRDQRNER